MTHVVDTVLWTVAPLPVFSLGRRENWRSVETFQRGSRRNAMHQQRSKSFWEKLLYLVLVVGCSAVLFSNDGRHVAELTCDLY